MQIFQHHFQFIFSSFRARQKQSPSYNNSARGDSPRRSVVIETPEKSFSDIQNDKLPDSAETQVVDNLAQDATDNAIIDASPPLVMTQSTLDTLNNMTTEKINSDNDKDLSKGFVISFGDESVKPKPVLKPRQASVTKIDSKDSSGLSSPVSTKDSLISTKISSPASDSSSTKNCDSLTPSACLVCNIRPVDTSAPGGKVCKLCSKMLIKINCDRSPEINKGKIMCNYN